MDEITTTLINTLAPAAATLITGLVSWGLYELARFVRSKTDSQVVNTAVDQVARTVDAVTRDLAATMVPAVKAASKDGKLTKEDAKWLKDEALDRIKAQLPGKMMRAAGKVSNDIDEMIKAEIEGAVARQKGEKAGTNGE